MCRHMTSLATQLHPRLILSATWAAVTLKMLPHHLTTQRLKKTRRTRPEHRWQHLGYFLLRIRFARVSVCFENDIHIPYFICLICSVSQHCSTIWCRLCCEGFEWLFRRTAWPTMQPEAFVFYPENCEIELIFFRCICYHIGTHFEYFKLSWFHKQSLIIGHETLQWRYY